MKTRFATGNKQKRDLNGPVFYLKIFDFIIAY